MCIILFNTNPFCTLQAGLIADGRMVANEARSQAASFRDMYGGPINVKALNERLGSYFHEYCVGHMGRPIGASVFIGGWDAKKG